MKTRTLTLMVLLGLLVAAMPAFALDLREARSTGLIGEQANGYATALAATSEAKALVADINAKRQQEYERISKEKSQPIDLVAKIAAQQIIAQLPPGSFYQGPDGSWQKR